MPDTKKDSIKNRHDLLNAKANNPEELLKVATELRSFLENTQSQNESWGKLRLKLSKKYPSFLQKVQIAFVYYYIRYLKQKYFRNEDFINTADNAKKSLVALEEEIKKDNFKYFLYLCSQSPNAEENSPFKETKLVGNFIPATLQLKQNLLNTKGIIDVKSMSIEDFYKRLDDIKDDEEALLDFTKNALDSNDPEEQLLLILYNVAENLEKTGSIFQIDLTKDNTKLAKAYSMISNTSKKKNFANTIEKYNGKTFDEKTLRDFKDALIDIGRTEEEPKKEESEENISLEDKLALNMADYISGRISASEFQKKDQQIRKSVKDKNKEDVKLQNLNEIDT